MRILVAPDSFKESLGAAEVADALAAGLAEALPGVALDLAPIADGGEGTVDALLAAAGGERVTVPVHDPLGRPLQAAFGLLADRRTAVVECAAASGLGLLAAGERDPLRASSYGTGELLLAAARHGAERIIVGLGGSATVDGGLGLLQAAGMTLLDDADTPLAAPAGGGALAGVAGIADTDRDPAFAGVRIEIASDVDNPLLGATGAAAVFGPQKGADPATVAVLDAGLAHFYDILEARFGVRVRERAGAGAAGGLGAALMAVFAAEPRPGIEVVAEACDLRARIAQADVVITGEGRIDAQTLHGKGPYGVAQLARALGRPVIAVGGSLADDAPLAADGPFDAFEAAVCRPQSEHDALAGARPQLVRAGTRIGRWLALATRLA